MSRNRPTITPYGVVAYVADFYGMKSASELLRRNDIKAPRRAKDYDVNLVQSVIHLKQVKLDVEKYMPALLSVDLSEQNAKKQSSHSYLTSDRTRACKECLADGTMHQAHWQHVAYTHCHVHSTRLTDACEHIYATKSWKPCKHCDALQEKTTLPIYLQHVLNLDTVEEKTTFIESLMAVAQRMHRPFDYIEAQLPWERLTTETISNILNDAFLLAANKHSFTIWSELLLKKRKDLGVGWECALHFGIERLENTLQRCQWSISASVNVDVHSILLRYHKQLDKLLYKSRYYIYEDDTPDGVAMRASNKMMAEMLDVKVDALRELIETDKLPVMKNSSRGDKLIFDIAESSVVLSKVKSWSIWFYFDTLLSPALTPKVLNTLLLDRQKINKHMISGNFDGSWQRDLGDFAITRDLIIEFEGVLRAMYEQELKDARHLSIKKVSKYLGIQENDVVYLIENGLLCWARWQRNQVELVDIDSLRALTANYVVVNREAILKDYEPAELAKIIHDCCGLSPLITDHVSPVKNGVIIYDKNHLNKCCLERALNKLEILYCYCISIPKMRRSST